jgi:hypothetical protein
MNNLPTVAVHDLMIHPLHNDLIAGTHGRGIWICDDITPLQQMNEGIEAADGYLYDQQIATQWKNISRGGSRGQFLFRGENPPRGAMINFYLGSATKQAKLTISDWKGEQKLDVELKDQTGINRYIWPFRFDPPKLDDKEQALFDRYTRATEWEERREIGNKLRESLEKRGQKFAGINRRTQKLNNIPADAGVYRVTLTVNGKSYTKALTVRMDPMFD